MIARVGLLTMVLLAGPAMAQDKGRPSDRALAPLVACRGIADPRARASCYDAALDKLQQSVADRTVVVMDREQVKDDSKANFGFGASQQLARIIAPKPPKAARAAAPEELEEVDSTVASAAPYGYDRWTIRLATGAVWRTTESGIPMAPKAGTEIRIRRGAVGSYIMRIGQARAVRAMRVN